MILSQRSDTLGSIASFLCLIHCLISPLLFAAQACSISCCAVAPMWWSAIDFLFLAISLWAVWHSAQNTSKEWIKYALWLSWFGVFIAIANEKLQIFMNIEYTLYISAMVLSITHLYNKKFCKCLSDECCSQSN